MAMHLLHIFQKASQVKRCMLLQKAFNLTTPRQVFHLFDFIKQQQYTQVKRFFALLLKCHSSVHAPFLQQAYALLK